MVEQSNSFIMSNPSQPIPVSANYAPQIPPRIHRDIPIYLNPNQNPNIDYNLWPSTTRTNPYAYYQQPSNAYSTNFENRFVQYAQNASRPTFDSIESIVKTISGLASLIDSTFYSMLNSFQTIISVAENFSNLRSLFTRIWSSFAFIRFLRTFYQKLLIFLRLRSKNDFNDIAWQQAFLNVDIQRQSVVPNDPNSLSQWPILLYFSFVLFGPFLFTKLLHFSMQSDDNNDNRMAKVYRAIALYDFIPSQNDELKMQKGQEVEIAPRSVQEKRNLINSGWILVRCADDYGLVPLNYLKIVD